MCPGSLCSADSQVFPLAIAAKHCPTPPACNPAAVPHAAALRAALPADEVLLAGVASLEAVPCMVRLLALPEPAYQAPLLEGVVASIGGVDASLAKAAGGALVEVVAQAGQPLAQQLAALLLQLWAREARCDAGERGACRLMGAWPVPAALVGCMHGAALHAVPSCTIACRLVCKRPVPGIRLPVTASATTAPATTAATAPPTTAPAATVPAPSGPRAWPRLSYAPHTCC